MTTIAMDNTEQTSRRRLTAFHEAAHAVVAVRAGLPLVPSGPKRWLSSDGGVVVEVFARAWNGTSGACGAGGRRLATSTVNHLKAAERAYWRRAYAAEAVVLLAGQKAEHRLTRHGQLWVYNVNDYALAKKCDGLDEFRTLVWRTRDIPDSLAAACHIVSLLRLRDRQVKKGIFRRVYIAAERLAWQAVGETRTWEAIERVAEAAIEHRRLTRSAVMTVCRESDVPGLLGFRPTWQV